MHDVGIIGLGAMGSAAAWQLARRGARVIGFDRYNPPHNLGSSHGETRIIRVAYFEDSLYVPLVQRAWELWLELQRAVGTTLLQQTGGLMIGPLDGVLVSGTLRSAEEHRLPHELLQRAAVEQRYPQLSLNAEMCAVYEAQAGFVLPELGVRSMLDQAKANGAELHTDEAVLSWKSKAEGGFSVQTSSSTYEVEKLLICNGAWLAGLTPELQVPLIVQRQVQSFVRDVETDVGFDPRNCPISIWEYAAERYFYSVPSWNGWVKVCLHGHGEPSEPDNIRRSVDDAELEVLKGLVAKHLPALDGQPWHAITCMYTTTPDSHFIIDWLPGAEDALFVSACSGHGFKFAPALGEAAAELLLGGHSAHDLSLFGLKRFTNEATQKK